MQGRLSALRSDNSENHEGSTSDTMQWHLLNYGKIKDINKEKIWKTKTKPDAKTEEKVPEKTKEINGNN